MFEGQLWLGGISNAYMFRDVSRDPRISLHTATIDTHVSDGDARLWGSGGDVEGPRKAGSRSHGGARTGSEVTQMAPRRVSLRAMSLGRRLLYRDTLRDTVRK
jgi:hypothetical protein